MAVPAHDERDHQSAPRYGLPTQPVIVPHTECDFSTAACTGMDGRLVNSGPLHGLTPTEAIPFSIHWLTSEGLGERAISYHLRDWIFSRQHYWGEPIPMIYCQVCGWNPVPQASLPAVLPEVERYEPTETGESPLANMPGWVDVRCPKCAGPGRRETDTMPNSAGLDWYFLRYCDPHKNHILADMDKWRYWMPVDVYIGGDEHNTLHLLCSHFIYLFLHDLGAVPPEYPEPYTAADWIIEVVTERILQKFGFDAIHEIQVLAPIYRGHAGVITLIDRLQERLNPATNSKPEPRLFCTTFRIGDKVMQTLHNYDKDVYNGDIGFVQSIDMIEQTLRVDFDGRVANFGWSEADQLSLAYGVSVHKAQGSEFPVVVLPVVTQHYTMLQRNLLYTLLLVRESCVRWQEAGVPSVWP